MRRQRVDHSDPPGLGRQQPHLVAAVPPPGLTNITVPVGAGADRGNMDETPMGGVIALTVGLRVHVPAYLETGEDPDLWWYSLQQGSQVPVLSGSWPVRDGVNPNPRLNGSTLNGNQDKPKPG